jgi:FKBP-type peptidyl-prolyl cis-trans isomerase (trigger factor)
MVGYESVDELNEHVQNETNKECVLRDRQIMDHQISTQLIEANEFDAPKSMVEQEKTRLLGNVKPDSLPQKAKEELQTMAEHNVKRAIIMDSIYEKEDDIEVTPEELNQMLEEHARANNQTKDELVSNLYNSNQMDSFVSVLRLASVVDFIINHAKKESEESDGNE